MAGKALLSLFFQSSISWKEKVVEYGGEDGNYSPKTRVGYCGWESVHMIVDVRAGEANAGSEIKLAIMVLVYLKM
jgi:hypothetical protein